MFSKYGNFNVLYTLSGGDLLKFDDVAQQTWNAVYITLLYKKDRGEYLNKLDKAYRESAKRK